MREAMDYEKMLEYCKMILNAETEEEVEEIKEQIPLNLSSNGWDNEEIEQYMTRLDHWSEMVENDEISIEEISRKVTRYEDSKEMLDVCVFLSTAETQEVAETFRQQLSNSLARRGHSDEEIVMYMKKVEQNMELLQTVGLHIDESGYLVEGGLILSPKTETMQEVPESLVKTYAPGIAAGAGLSLAIGLLLLRIKVFKNKKNRNL